MNSRNWRAYIAFSGPAFVLLWALCFVAGALATVLAQQSIPNHIDTVKAARQTYAGLPPGRLRAYCIVNRVAWDLRADGVGLFFKEGENGYNSRSSDVIIYKPRGETFDILGDAEGQAIPQWGRTQPTGFGDVKLWRAPQDPATVTVCGKVEPPDPTEPEQPPASDLTPRVAALEKQVTAMAAAVKSLQADLAANGKADAALADRVKALEDKPAAGSCTAQEVSTSQVWGHAHKVQTCLP